LQNHNHSAAVRKQWSDEQMKLTLNSVLEDGMSAKAAVIYGVLCSTLKDRLSGDVIHGHNLGPDPYLNVEEEKELASRFN